jgi:hypothetical protein
VNHNDCMLLFLALRARAPEKLRALRDGPADGESWARHEIGIDDPLFIARSCEMREWWRAHPHKGNTRQLLPTPTWTAIECDAIAGDSPTEAAWRVRAENFLRLPHRGTPVDWWFSGWIAEVRLLLDDLEKMVYPPERKGRKRETDRAFEWFVERNILGRRGRGISRSEHVAESSVSRGANAVARRLGVAPKTQASRRGAKDLQGRRERRDSR